MDEREFLSSLRDAEALLSDKEEKELHLSIVWGFSLALLVVIFIFWFVMSNSGYAGAAAFMVTLATFGGPGGMFGGIVVLLLVFFLSGVFITRFFSTNQKERKKTSLALIHDKLKNIYAETISHSADLDQYSLQKDQDIQRMQIILKSLEINLETDRKETISDIQNLIKKLDRQMYDDWNTEDIKYDLFEITKCLRTKSHRAVLVLCGRILELVLKINLTRHRVIFSDMAMNGELIQLHSKNKIYIDPATDNIWKLINQQRIIGVHDKANAPIPSLHQAIMVCHAILDVTERVFGEEPN